ncbi:MAG: alkaline phosphatase family protein [Acidimicrobiales bacterium]
MPGNVLFITVDQYRGDSLSYLGHQLVKTPSIDTLCRQGTCFANHWSVTAPCGPSRASLYTGMYMHHHRSVRNGTPLDARFTNIALEARQAGYDPVLFGYTDTSADPRTVPPGDPRLVSYEGLLPGFRAVVNDPFEAGGIQWGRWLAGRGYDVPSNPHDLYRPATSFPGASEHASSWAPSQFGPDDTESAFLTEQVMSWLDRNGGKPFFAHVSYIRPHPPYRNPPGYHDLYSADDVPCFAAHATRETELAMHPLNATLLSRAPIAAPDDLRERRQLRATYHGMQTEVDHQLGRLLDHLTASGLHRETLVVLTSDHGEMGGDHWAFQKAGYWDETFAVPLVIADPRAGADAGRGRIIEAFTESVDVMATILEWLGCDVPLQVDGSSLIPFLRNEVAPPNWRSEAHFEWDFRQPDTRLVETSLGIPSAHCSLAVLRGPETKYVHFAADEALLPPLLFDLRDDPQQLTNRANDPACMDQRLNCAEQLVSWRMRHDDVTLANHLLTPNGVVHHRDSWR